MKLIGKLVIVVGCLFHFYCCTTDNKPKSNTSEPLTNDFLDIYKRAENFATKDPEKALIIIDSALVLLNGQDLPDLQWKAYALKGNALRHLNKNEEAYTWLRKSYDLAEKSGIEEGITTAGMNLGSLYVVEKKHKEALDFFLASRNALHSDSTEQQRKTKAMLCGNIGLIFKNTHRYHDAIREFQEGILLCKKYDLPELKWGFYNNISLVHAEMGDHLAELDYLKKAAQAIPQGDARIGSVWNNMANALLHLDSLEASAKWLQKVLDCEKCLPASRLKALNGMVENLLESGQPGKAADLARQALDLAKSLKNKREEIRAIANTGRIHLGLGQYAEALRHFEAAKSMLKQSPNVAPPSDYPMLMRYYLEASMFAKGYADAVHLFKEYATLQDSIYDKDMVESVQNLRIHYETQQTEDSLKIVAAENRLHKTLATRRKTLASGLGLLALLAFAIAWLTWKNLRLQQQKNRSLADDLYQIEQQNEALLKDLSAVRQQALPTIEFAGKTIAITSNQQTVALRLGDILYLQSMGNAVYFNTVSGKHLVWQPLHHFMKILPPEMFLQTHRSHVVNKLHIATSTARLITLTNGTEVPVGGSFSHSVKEALKNGV